MLRRSYTSLVVLEEQEGLSQLSPSMLALLTLSAEGE